MNTRRGEIQQCHLVASIFLVVVMLGLGVQGCQFETQPADEALTNKTTLINETSPSFQSTPETLQPTLAGETATLPSESHYQPVWENYSPPSIDPATPIPPPLKDLRVSDEILIWVLLGSDTEPPFIGRTQAIHLLFIHTRFSKASLVSIPGDLYVYIPGYTMQRLSTAYTLGGIETLRNTLTYNFGVNPSRFVLAHPGDFQWLVDDINGIEVTVFYPMPQACGGIRAGEVQMDGALALCYASYREGMDEFDRMRRQQQLLRIIFLKLTHDGNLIQLPLLYASYEGWIKTDLSLPELMDYIPLSLRLADKDRIRYFMIGWEQTRLWQVPGYSQAQVFLPDQDGVRDVLQQAIDAVMTPKPLTNQVPTLEAQLTAASQATGTPVVTTTPIPTVTPTMTSSLGGTITATKEGSTIHATPSPTLTLTPPGYP